jgi:hypothetical protein
LLKATLLKSSIRIAMIDSLHLLDSNLITVISTVASIRIIEIYFNHKIELTKSFKMSMGSR